MSVSSFNARSARTRGRGPARAPGGTLSREAGFSLFEVVIAMSVLMTGLLGLAQAFYMGFSIAMTSTPNLVAREKAREAIESVHTARDTHTILWAQIRNAAPPTCPAGMTAVGGGAFVNNEDAMKAPGPDGLVGTSDDTGSEMTPGPDSQFGTSDDLPLVGYTRQVDICDVDGNRDLRQIMVTIRYDGSKAFGSSRRQYRLTTFISRFS